MSIGTRSPNREKMEEEKMKLNMRKAISFILTLMLVVSVMPTTFAIGVSDTGEVNRMNSGVVRDDDATGGYEGDYVVIYNPGTSTSSSVSTGTLTGLTSSAPVETYYTVTFKDWDGTVLSTQSVLEGTAATAPADPTREGYTFTG